MFLCVMFLVSIHDLCLYFFNAIFSNCYMLFFLLFVVYLMLCKGCWMLLFFFLCCTRNYCDLFVLMHAFFYCSCVIMIFCNLICAYNLFIYICVHRCYYHFIFVFEVYCMWKYWLFFFLIHFALFIILSNLDVHNSCVQMLVTLRGCFVDLHISFLIFWC